MHMLKINECLVAKNLASYCMHEECYETNEYSNDTMLFCSCIP